MAYDSLMEKEANLFAMELMMPEKFLREDIGPDGVDVFDDAAINKLARKYKVPASVMAARLVQLHLEVTEQET
ncbi:MULTISPECIES: ImmA/IrrE family metallo-endopeptidase [unclassified Roseobacter]|uniref:ImmA/IrrE family metallo-endopeptidase n=1 Tax=unclassified Roseobacter TaxID=196798 RepID=UPI001492F939|nr:MULTISPECIES: ImmA/IrrE family metallo-endopeptidase [unclassified Roseobacter]NNW55469.1 ImmA/IrrE family metallo-endopeptidase [Roseobacter sp. HKCCD8284]NNY17290.1 ImmA/IrrE family metallo-endopeptidase [Roseobacter sp. HKCCD8191]